MDRDRTDFDPAMDFDLGVEEIERHSGLSLGAAQARLRELCASGVVRSWSVTYLGSRPIKPSDWKRGEVDLETGSRIVVIIVDLNHQINSREESPRRAEIANQLRKGLKPGENISWKKFCETIRKQCDARPGDRGFSDETIENVTREMMRTSPERASVKSVDRR